MPRGGSKVNPTFKMILSEARRDLWNAWLRAKNFQHSGIRGDEREEAVRKFLRERLPGAYAAVKGEAIDFQDRHSTQLDIAIYDCIRNCPLIAKSDQILLPAEALLSVVEVKSVLTLDELKTCFEAAKQLRRLKPFKENFVDTRLNGTWADDRKPRCFYTVLAYESNLGPSEWLTKEWDRVNKAADEVQCQPNIIDRILVLDRGLIIPTFQSGKIIAVDSEEALHEWFLHLINFLSRENARRPAVDWQLYTSRRARGWQRL